MFQKDDWDRFSLGTGSGTRNQSGTASLCYFGAVRTVSLGSSTILWVPAGASRRKDDSSPSAKTLPSNTDCFPLTAYTGTDVTRSCGASFCTIIPLTTDPLLFGVNFTDFNC